MNINRGLFLVQKKSFPNRGSNFSSAFDLLSFDSCSLLWQIEFSNSIFGVSRMQIERHTVAEAEECRGL
jgi:hypothetical protein